MLKHRGHRERPEYTEISTSPGQELQAMRKATNLTRPPRIILAMFVVLCVVAPTVGASMSKSGFVTSSDGVKIHYVEAGTTRTTGGVPASSILFIPGWTMPAWIWQKQIDYFSPKYRVVAIDPRCQGESSQTA